MYRQVKAAISVEVVQPDGRRSLQPATFTQPAETGGTDSTEVTEDTSPVTRRAIVPVADLEDRHTVVHLASQCLRGLLIDLSLLETDVYK